MQSTRKTREGGKHPDRDAQFHHIASKVAQYQTAGDPAISVDTKKKGLRIHAELDKNTDEAGIKVSEQELAELATERDEFHGEWSYKFTPRKMPDTV